MKIVLYVLLLLLQSSAPLFGQGHDNTMIFGYLGGDDSPNEDKFGMNILKFTNGNIEITDNQNIDLFFNDTDAAMSDSVGNLIFYFNGIDIYDQSEQLMHNGGILNPFNASGYDLPQGGIAIPYPGRPDQYILFHQREGYIYEPLFGWNCVGLYYSVIDMTQKNGLGSVVQKKVPLLIDTLEYGKLDVVRHANGRDWWLTTTKSHSNIFFNFLISPTGIQPQPAQPVGTERKYGIGQAYFSRDGSKYVMFNNIGNDSLQEYQFIDIYDFDRCSGIFSGHERIHILEQGGGGMSISSNSRWLYVAANTLLYQFDLWETPVESSQELIATHIPFDDPFPTNFNRSFLAPDNKIYITTTSGSRTLHVINDPDEPGTTCNFQQAGVRLPCNNNKSLPTFANYRLGPLDGSTCDSLGIDNNPVAWYRYEQDTLQPNLVQFHDLSYFEPDSWLWDFGDGNTSTERHPLHLYALPGTYEVCLTVSNPNSSHTHCKTIYGVTASENPTVQAAIQVTPNPFHAELRVALNTPLRSPVFHLYDAMGRQVAAQPISVGMTAIQTTHLKAGMYFWVLEAGGERVKAGKVVKF